MQALKCELCGGNDIVKQDGYYVCQHCGTRYSPEEAKKLMIEGSVKIDNSERIKNLYDLGRRAKDQSDFKQLEQYYSEILKEVPHDWEAMFYSTLGGSVNSIGRLSPENPRDAVSRVVSASNKLQNCIKDVIQAIRGLSSDDEKGKAIKQVVQDTGYFSDAWMDLLNGIPAQYCKNGSTPNCYLDKTLLINGINLNFSLLTQFIDECFQDKVPHSKELILECGKRYINNLNRDLTNSFQYMKQTDGIIRSYNTSFCKDVYEIIIKYEPSYVIPPLKSPTTTQAGQSNTSAQSNKSGCYVATAVYGSYDCPQVWVLRRYRDSILAETWYGRAFVHIYYEISPTLVKWFGNTKWFRNIWKPTLDKKVAKLHSKGVADTPYQDKEWRK